MKSSETTKKVVSLSLKDLITEPKSILKGPKGPWPETQAKVLEIFLNKGTEPVLRQELLALFKGNRNPVDKAIQLLNIRLKKFGAQIAGYQIYIIEPTEPENQLRLFR